MHLVSTKRLISCFSLCQCHTLVLMPRSHLPLPYTHSSFLLSSTGPYIVADSALTLHIAHSTLPTHRLFSVFDALAGHHGVQKVETAGDCYIVAAGILTLDGEGYSEVCMVWGERVVILTPNGAIYRDVVEGSFEYNDYTRM